VLVVDTGNETLISHVNYLVNAVLRRHPEIGRQGKVGTAVHVSLFASLSKK
jgi:hypothetical protein